MAQKKMGSTLIGLHIKIQEPIKGKRSQENREEVDSIIFTM